MVKPMKAYNLRTKRKEVMKNPKLVSKKTKRGTTYMLMSKGSDGTTLSRIISHDDAKAFKTGKTARRRKSTSKRKSRRSMKLSCECKPVQKRRRKRSTGKRKSRKSKRKSRRRRKSSNYLFF